MERFERLVASVSRGADYVAQCSVVAMMVLLVGNILLRQVWKPILGTYEWVCFLSAIAVGLAIPYCGVKKGHVAVKLLLEKYPKRARRIIEIITVSLCIVMMAIVSWQNGVYATQMWQSGQVSPTTRIPYFWFVYGVAFGFAVLTLVLVADLCKLVIKRSSK